LINAAGRKSKQRTTLYGDVSEPQRRKSYEAAPLKDIINNPVRKRAKGKAKARTPQEKISFQGAAN